MVRQTIDGEEYPYRASELTGNSGAEDLVGYDRFLTASGAYKHHKPPMLLPSDWGGGGGGKARIVPSSCSTMFQVMLTILNSETQDKQAMYGMRLTSRQRLITILPW